jgi:hypothetical protein
VTARDLCGQLVSSDSSDERPTKYVRTKENRARQALRIAELTRDGYSVVQGPGGATVFRWGCGDER